MGLHLIRRSASCVLLTACAVTPLTNKIRVGEEPFVVLVGEGPDRETDLFAAPAGGGAFARLTFNRAIESAPALAPKGILLAYVRESGGAQPKREVVVHNLVTNGEGVIPLPASSGAPSRLGWSGDGSSLFVRTEGGTFRSLGAAGPAEPVSADWAARADTALAVLVGEPAFGEVIGCTGGGGGLCVRAASGENTPLAPDGRDPFRWGGDSIAYVRQGTIEIRPLSAGRPRRPVWKEAPANLRSPTYHPGRGAQLPRATGLSGER